MTWKTRSTCAWRSSLLALPPDAAAVAAAAAAADPAAAPVRGVVNPLPISSYIESVTWGRKIHHQLVVGCSDTKRVRIPNTDRKGCRNITKIGYHTTYGIVFILIKRPMGPSAIRILG